MKSNLSLRLKNLRAKKGLTLAEISERLETSPSTYRDWENGREIRGEGPYLKLAELYEVSLSYLLTGKDNSENQANELTQIEMKLKECLIAIKKMRSDL